jgi:hypothetical protein
MQSHAGPRPYTTGFPITVQTTDPETTRIATEPERFGTGSGLEMSASPDSNITATSQDTERIGDVKSIPAESSFANTASNSSTTGTNVPERTANVRVAEDGKLTDVPQFSRTASRRCNCVRSTSQLLRTFRDSSSDEIMVFLLAKDLGAVSAQQMVESFHNQGFLKDCRPGWLQLLASNSWISHT